MSIITHIAMLVAGATGGGGSPDAAPSSGILYNYSGDYVGIQWTNGDADASTEIGWSEDYSTEPVQISDKVGPGATQYESTAQGTIASEDTTTTALRGWVRHLKNGNRTAWVRADRMVPDYSGLVVPT